MPLRSTGLLLAGLAAACSSGTGTGSERTGTLGLAITAPDGITIDEIRYAITGPTPQTGTIDVSGANTGISFLVGGLAAGAGYTVTLSATDTAGTLCTSAPASFIVAFQQTADVAMTLVCTIGDGGFVVADAGSGSVQVGATVMPVLNPTTLCPAISAFSVSSTAVVVGASIDLSTSTVPGADAVTYSAVSPGDAQAGAGTFASGSAGETFTCTGAGEVQLTATTTAPLANDAGSCPPQSVSVLVSCEASCTGTGETLCRTSCVDTQTDDSNCGGCAPPLGSGAACVGGTSCVAGSCSCADSDQPNQCPATGTPTLCTNFQTDPDNCGHCGNACGGATPYCVAGVCAGGCGNANTLCGGVCVNTATSAAHCGGCGLACDTGGTCATSTCGCPAAKPFDCNGTSECTDDHCGAGYACVANSAKNCGGCGIVCDKGTTCSATGVCQCAGSKLDCNGTVACPSGHCGAGFQCVAPIGGACP